MDNPGDIMLGVLIMGIVIGVVIYMVDKAKAKKNGTGRRDDKQSRR